MTDEWAPYTFPYKHRFGDPLVFPVVGGARDQPRKCDKEKYVSVEMAARRLHSTPEDVVQWLREGHLVAHWAQLNPDDKLGVPRVNRNSVEEYRKRLIKQQRLAQVGPQGRRGNSSTAWSVEYKNRIEAGVEHCRHCGSQTKLRVARILGPEPWVLRNATILCAECVRDYSTYEGIVGWRRNIKSLLDEENERPWEQRWGLLAMRREAARLQSRDLSV